MVEINHLYAGYQRKEVISDITFWCSDASVTTIVGPNGCGKSTLLKTLAGLCEVFDGEILLNERDRCQMSEREAAQKISYLAQIHDRPMITVERLVLHGRFPYLEYPRHYTKKDVVLCDQVMKMTKIYDLKDKRMDELSGGQCQKVYLAMALVKQSNVLLFDEPTTYLDIQYQLELLDMMRKLRQDGKTVIAVLHDINEAMRISDQIILMKQGRILAKGTPEELLQSGKMEELFKIHLSKYEDPDGDLHYLVK